MRVTFDKNVCQMHVNITNTVIMKFYFLLRKTKKKEKKRRLNYYILFLSKQVNGVRNHIGPF